MAKKKTTNSIVLTARQLLQGYTTDVDRRFMWNTAPYQMIPVKEKDDEWRKWNMDWMEHVGIKQLMNENKRLARNYDMANGVICKSDYIVTDTNEYSSMIGIITEKETHSPFSLKFYPIIPNVVNILIGEFAKRDKRIIVKAVDEFSRNEALEAKMSEIGQILARDAQIKMMNAQIENGIDPETPEAMEELNAVGELASAEIKFKNFRGMGETWGQKIINSADHRFKMYEKEVYGFRDSLCVDREFWHVNLFEDQDFDVELWNPLYTFYHKSPDVSYISEGNYVGQIKLMSIPDVIDMFGHLMNEEQLNELKHAQGLALHGGNVVDDTRRHDSTQFWDASVPYDKQQPNSINYEQYMGMKNIYNDAHNIDWNRIRNMSGDEYTWQSLIRVTKCYWKSQRKVGDLTRIMEDGSVMKMIVDENYKVTIKPVYDKSIVKKEAADNLVYGEHIDWIWVNETWGGIKLGPNTTTYYESKGFGFDPIYLKVEPIPFQFKGRSSLYGSKLPVEGRIFSDRNSRSSALVDKMYSAQVGFNIVNNQTVDFLADEVGKVVLIDQNMIPRNSLDGSWGKHNYPKFYQVMKDFQLAPVDSSLQNTESPGTSFNHFQMVDLSKTDQLLARIQLAQYFKNEAYAVVGITPQRIGAVQASESATGVQQAVNNSYAQTEIYFEQHMNFLMPRVYQMILEAAQYVTSEQIKRRGYADVTYVSNNEETEWIRMEEDKLLLRDYDIYAMSKANIRDVLQKLQQLAVENNTAGGSLYEIAQMLNSSSPAEIISKLKQADDKRQKDLEDQRQHEAQLQKEQQEFLEFQAQKQLENENYWKEREIQKDIYIAELAAEKGTQPLEDSSIEIFNSNTEREAMIQDQLLKQKDMDQKAKEHQDKVEIDKKKLEVEKYKADMTLRVAKENKNASDIKKKKK